MLEHLTTEARNPASEDLDALKPIELVRLMNREDAKVAGAVAEQADAIASAIEGISQRLAQEGRLVYVGAGTSGRLGVLDAAECPPTFNSNPDQVVGVIAGGPQAVFRAIEGAEDSAATGAADMRQLNLSEHDALVGIATSGRTPYVMGAVDYAKQVGALTIGLTCNQDAELNARVDIAISVVVGPELLTGSTRLKAGTATKMVLNMLSTGAMVLLGKTYGNLMVDLRATNIKLADRACRIVSSLTSLSKSQSAELLARCDGELKTAVVAHRLGRTPDEARALLEAAQGHLRHAMECQPDKGV